MTDKEKLKEIKKLADAMYYAAQYLTTDASRLHKAMNEYHQFIIHEWREEPVSEKKCMFTKDGYTDEDRKVLCDGCEEDCEYAQREESVSEDTMTIRKDWFEHCKKSWYNEGYIDGKHNRDGQFGEPVSDECIYNRTLEEKQRSCKFCSAACQVRIKEEPVSKVWHDSNEEPNNMSHCLVFYGDKSLIGHYLHYEPVLYNKQDKVFVTVAYPHPTGYKVEQKSLDGGCVAEVHKDKRDRISISNITSWCYLNDLHNLTQKEEPVSEELEEAREEAIH